MRHYWETISRYYADTPSGSLASLGLFLDRHPEERMAVAGEGPIPSSCRRMKGDSSPSVWPELAKGRVPRDLWKGREVE